MRGQHPPHDRRRQRSGGGAGGGQAIAESTAGGDEARCALGSGFRLGGTVGMVAELSRRYSGEQMAVKAVEAARRAAEDEISRRQQREERFDGVFVLTGHHRRHPRGPKVGRQRLAVEDLVRIEPVAVKGRGDQHQIGARQGLQVGGLEAAARGGDGPRFEGHHQAAARPALASRCDGCRQRGGVVGEVVHHGDVFSLAHHLLAARHAGKARNRLHGLLEIDPGRDRSRHRHGCVVEVVLARHRDPQ